MNWLICQFPEMLFKPQKNKEEYYDRIIHGKKIMSDSVVLFCGLARNIESVIKYTIARIEHLGSLFADYKVVLYENDSEDNTKEILFDWREKNSRVFIISENLRKKQHEQDTSLERTTDMAYYRNKYLNYIKSKDFFGSDYTIVLDTDILGGFSYFGIMNSLSYDNDVMTSNGIMYRNRNQVFEKLYFDTFAHRPINREKVEDHSIYNLLDYKVGQEPVKVFSGFGGLAIYKTSVFSPSVMYLPNDCDHPTLHKQLRECGKEIYLNPSQIVLYNEHEYVI